MRGDRQRGLGDLLKRAGFTPAAGRARPSITDVLRSQYVDEILDVYKKLGGLGTTPAVRPGPWDLPLQGLIVELDEYLHFNRYRKHTLESTLYKLLPGFPLAEYLEFCDRFEPECLRYGKGQKRWARDSCDVEFGISTPPGDLSGNGPSRWKQRAFYDFVKDLSPLLIGVSVVRVSIWDLVTIAGTARRVGEVLDVPTDAAIEPLAALVRQRARG